MTLDEMKMVWTTAARPRATEALARFVGDDFRRARRRRRIKHMLAFAHHATVAAGLVGLVGYVALVRPPRMAMVPALLALVIPMAGLLYVRFRALSEERAEWRRGGASLIDAVESSAAAAGHDLRATRQVLWAQAVTAIVLPLVLWQESAAGLATPRQLWSQAGLFYTALLAAVGFILVQRARISRRAGELAELRTALAGDGPERSDEECSSAAQPY